MAGRIPDSDIATIRDRVRIEDIIGDYVALKRAGADSLKGLCPFHDEKSPSFHVRPNHGHFHCFGCGEGGDVYTFIQKLEHITFVEAVEQLADKIGYQINYEGGGTSVQRDKGTRSRLIAANAAAQKFYAQQLSLPEAEVARKYLQERDFDGLAALKFGCGYAPSGWDVMTKALLAQGFEAKELEAAGLSKQGQRGIIDRFHRRLLWPIRNSSGDVIGFGARKLFDDDNMGKYMNTPETLLYKKSQVLFGLDHARKAIAKNHRAVIVEGYTDVMAMHMAGETTAVASCGTAFGEEHVSLIRRLLMDDNYFSGEIIYTFDGDEAGKAAALKAFDGDQAIAAKTYVAIAPDGMDPCELRQKNGDSAVRDLIARRVPMFEFAARALVGEKNLDSADGRVQALNSAIPVVARIKDNALRDDYARQLAGWVGWDPVSEVVHRVRQESLRNSKSQGRQTKQMATAVGKSLSGEKRDTGNPTTMPVMAFVIPQANDPRLWAQREALKSAIQYPGISGTVFDSLPEEAFSDQTYAAVYRALLTAGGTAAGLSGAQWVAAIGEQLPKEFPPVLLSELAASPLLVEEQALDRYIRSVLARVQEVWVGGQVAELKSKVMRMKTDEPNYNALFGDLMALEAYRRSLLEQALGPDEF